MSGGIEQFLEEKLLAGGFCIGEVRVRKDCSMHHLEDTDSESDLEEFTAASDAAAIALYDSSGKFRPLKSAPSLRRGWVLRLPGVDEVRLALDAIYPAALGLWVAWKKEQLPITSWRETVNRQTGMYRIVGKITDAQSEALIAKTCQRESGCLRRILWKVDAGNPHSLTVDNREFLLQLEKTGEIPILCREACNLLVAAGRPVVKAAQTSPA